MGRGLIRDGDLFLKNELQMWPLIREELKEARNRFVGHAQTGFQFSHETQKLKQTNKNGVALLSGFNILRRSFKSCV